MWMDTEIVALDTSSQTYYSPWFDKVADNAVFTMEKVLDTLNAGLTVRVFTKNREDEGSAPGSSAGTFTTLSGTMLEVACSGLKELVRFELSFQASAVKQGVILRFLAPTWYDTAV